MAYDGNSGTSIPVNAWYANNSFQTGGFELSVGANLKGQAGVALSAPQAANSNPFDMTGVMQPVFNLAVDPSGVPFGSTSAGNTLPTNLLGVAAGVFAGTTGNAIGQFTWNDTGLTVGLANSSMTLFDAGGGNTGVASAATPLPVSTPTASGSSLAQITSGAVITLANGYLLQNLSAAAWWNGSVGSDTFTALLQVSPTGAYAGEEITLATLTESNLDDAVAAKPWPYSRLKLTALTLDTATALNLFASGAL
jgi:hypothetical protein